MLEAICRSQIGDGERRGFLSGHLRRPRVHEIATSDDVRRQAARGDGHDVVADAQVRHARTDRGNLASTLAAERPRIARVHTQGTEHVLEVQAYRFDGDFNLPGTRWPPGQRLASQPIDGVRVTTLVLPRPQVRWWFTHAATVRQARNQTSLRTAGNLKLGLGRVEFPQALRPFVGTAARIEVDAGRLQLRMLQP